MLSLDKDSARRVEYKESPQFFLLFPSRSLSCASAKVCKASGIQRKPAVFSFISEPPPILRVSESVQDEWKQKWRGPSEASPCTYL